MNILTKKAPKQVVLKQLLDQKSQITEQLLVNTRELEEQKKLW